MGIEPTEMFLSPDDLAFLTGFRQRPRQIQQLRAMGIPFYVNAGGNPVVTKAAVEGKKDAKPKEKTREPKWENI